MGQRLLWVAVMGLFVPVWAGVAVADAPLADAGLDQSVTLGTTVQLDATGSTAPNGSIASYDWRIVADDGTAVTPSCRDCGRPSFTPYQSGEYEVTVTVTDDTGRTDSDTLYVTVDDEGVEAPSISLSGDEDPTVGYEGEYTAAVTSDVPLVNITWSVDGSKETERQLSGTENSSTFTNSFGSLDDTEITVTVVDKAGQRSNETLAVEPGPQTSSSSSGGGSSSTSGYYDRQYDGGNGGWIETGDDGRPLGPTSEQDAVNYISNNGIESNVAANPTDPTTSDMERDDGNDSPYDEY